MSEEYEPSKPTQRAQLACANWLIKCLKFGWDKSCLDDLERIWWCHHDNFGRLRDTKEQPHE